MTENKGISHIIVNRSGLASVLRGGMHQSNTRAAIDIKTQLQPREIAVVLSNTTNRPCAIIVNDAESNEFLSWLHVYHSDLSPLTSWCHLFSKTDWLKLQNENIIYSNLFGLESAWSGAIIAEAAFKNNRAYQNLSLASCCATQSFAIARTFGIHGLKPADALLRKTPQTTLRPYHMGSNLHDAQLKILHALLHIMDDNSDVNQEFKSMISVCRHIHLNGGYIEAGKDLIDRALFELFKTVPGLPQISKFSNVSAEDSVRLLRSMRDILSQVTATSKDNFVFLAGFIIAHIGGAERDLRLAEQFDKLAPEVGLWATLVGGLGADASWNNTFMGLGRLVCRELTRPFHVLDSPTCDIAISELNFIEKTSPGRITSIRSANRSVLSVNVMPGVSINYQVSREQDTKTEPDVVRKPATSTQEIRSADTFRDVDLDQLAKRLAPYLKPLMRSDIPSASNKKITKKTQAELKLKS